MLVGSTPKRLQNANYDLWQSDTTSSQTKQKLHLTVVLYTLLRSRLLTSSYHTFRQDHKFRVVSGYTAYKLQMIF